MLAKLPATPFLTTRCLLVVAATTLSVTAVVPVTLVQAAATVSVSPASVPQGSDITLAMEGCGANTAQAVSSAFDRVTLTPGTTTGSFSGQAFVLDNASPGTHQVTFECGPSVERVVTSFQVIPGPALGGMGGSITAMNPREIALGGALVASALGAGAWVVRRRVTP
ncbi:hypothetical protein ACWF95_40685 [Streptomyces vinaceus]